MKVSQNVSFTFIEENKETDDVILQKIYSDDNGRVKKREVFMNEKSKYMIILSLLVNQVSSVKIHID